MSTNRRNKGRISGPFVPMLKDTMKTGAWKALSHGARSLYVALKGRYNSKAENAVYLSTRDGEEELGRNSNRHNIMLWFHELEYYGFVVTVSPAHHGVLYGKAPHLRLTEEWYLGKAPTRDFLNWDGKPFTEKRKRSATLFTAKKNRIRGDHGVTTLATTESPVVPEIVGAAAESGDQGVAISSDIAGDHGVSITNLTTSYDEPDLLSAYEAMWTSPPVPIAFRPLRLRRLFERPAKRPGKRAEAHYLAAWYRDEEQDLRAAV